MDRYPLEITKAHFAYGEVPVLRGVSLYVRAGEIVALIGPNGAGKSTLIRLAAGLLPDRGQSVRLLGRPISAWTRRELARVLTLVPQHAHIPPTFTVWEAVILGRTPYLGFLGTTSRRDREMVEWALEQVGGSHLVGRYFGDLSGGERQRVILARALAQEPRCLLLDEPTTHLDIHHQVSILSLVRDLARRRRMAVLTVLHDLNLASTFADRIALMDQGRIVACGAPAEVLHAECLGAIYGEGVMVYPRPDDGGRPVVLPRIPFVEPEHVH